MGKARRWVGGDLLPVTSDERVNDKLKQQVSGSE